MDMYYSEKPKWNRSLNWLDFSWKPIIVYFKEEIKMKEIKSKSIKKRKC
jgi:hypothetical protein